MANIKSSEVEKWSSLNRDQLLTIGDLLDFRMTLINDIRLLLTETPSQQKKQWLKSNEVRKMLGISPGTLQNMRINGTLPYTKIGGIVFYNYDDIARLLNTSTSK